MTINCKVHDKEIAIAVCHHCGQPICNNVVNLSDRSTSFRSSSGKDKPCGYIIADDVFFVEDNEGLIRAYHCEACLHQYHTEYNQQLQKILLK